MLVGGKPHEVSSFFNGRTSQISPGVEWQCSTGPARQWQASTKSDVIVDYAFVVCVSSGKYAPTHIQKILHRINDIRQRDVSVQVFTQIWEVYPPVIKRGKWKFPINGVFWEIYL